MIPNDVYAVYTGGSTWLFIGSCSTENQGQQHYLITDKGFALILNANPREYYDDICDAGWQREHEIAELGDGERQEFTKAALSLLRAYLAEDAGSARAGGITEQDIINHEEAWECLD